MEMCDWKRFSSSIEILLLSKSIKGRCFGISLHKFQITNLMGYKCITQLFFFFFSELRIMVFNLLV